jgi:hypothetical protein
MEAIMSSLRRFIALVGVLAATPLMAQQPVVRSKTVAVYNGQGEEMDAPIHVRPSEQLRVANHQSLYRSSGLVPASPAVPEDSLEPVSESSGSEMPATFRQSHGDQDCAMPCEPSCDCGEAGCTVCCCRPYWQHRSSIWGGFLYLHANDVDMAHAIQQNGTGGAGTVPDGLVGVAAPEYEPAFIVGANWALSDCSSIWASYTHFESRTTDSLAAPPGVGGTVNSLVLHPGTVNAGSTSSFVEADYDIDFEMVDLNFSRLMSGSNRHAINYHAGARYASLDQRFNQTGVFAPPTGDLNTSSIIDFEGVGPRIGIDGRGRLGCGGFSIYGNTFLSFLLGEFHSTYEQFNFTTDTREAFSDWTDTRLVPQLESEIGLSWQNCSGCFRVSAGYQLQWWFNAITVGDHVRAVQNNNFVDVGDTIVFDGLTTRVEWRF